MERESKKRRNLASHRIKIKIKVYSDFSACLISSKSVKTSFKICVGIGFGGVYKGSMYVQYVPVNHAYVPAFTICRGQL